MVFKKTGFELKILIHFKLISQCAIFTRNCLIFLGEFGIIDFANSPKISMLSINQLKPKIPKNFHVPN